MVWIFFAVAVAVEVAMKIMIMNQIHREGQREARRGEVMEQVHAMLAVWANTWPEPETKAKLLSVIGQPVEYQRRASDPPEANFAHRRRIPVIK